MNKRALSLLEILVASIVLALVVMGLASIFVLGKRHILHTRSRMTAAELGRYFLDPLQMDVRQDTWNNASINNLSVGPRTTNVSIAPVTYNATYDITNVSGTSLRRVKVNITWYEPSP